ncbi:MAG: hypothetical protein J0L82_15690 [Deltaproteobacteria bacterium]|jgi:lysophospholipase L1-like esterase|nr:hypothetical protein [Deltaproteobacteria bacterium]
MKDSSVGKTTGLAVALELVKWCAVIIAMVVGPLLVTEAWFRFKASRLRALDQKPPVVELFVRTMDTVVQPRIDRGWARPLSARPNIFSPPLDTYINSGFDDENRLRLVAEKMRLPPSSTWKVPNFLRNPNEDSDHVITSNSLGFRNSERPAEKADSTFRIIALGSYPVFGHGVNDNETYPHFLEREMNSAAWLKKLSKFACRKIRKVEIWNAGRQGATAIMGYARLVYDVEPLKPDLIIWDFGWIDSYLRSDQGSIEGIEKLRVIRHSQWKRRLFGYCRGAFLGELELCRRFLREATALAAQQGINGWTEANRRAGSWAEQRKLPILFIRHQGVSIKPDLYEWTHQPNKMQFFVDTSPAIDDAKPTAEEIKTFWSKPTWVAEVGITREQTQDNSLVVFRTDAIQYNDMGYKRIADFISKQTSEILAGLPNGGEFAASCGKR